MADQAPTVTNLNLVGQNANETMLSKINDMIKERKAQEQRGNLWWNQECATFHCADNFGYLFEKYFPHLSEKRLKEFSPHELLKLNDYLLYKIKRYLVYRAMPLSILSAISLVFLGITFWPIFLPTMGVALWIWWLTTPRDLIGKKRPFHRTFQDDKTVLSWKYWR